MFQLVKDIFAVSCIKTSLLRKIATVWGGDWRCGEEECLVTSSSASLVAVASAYFWYGQEAAVVALSW